jgi:sialate O-acetylesterase
MEMPVRGFGNQPVLHSTELLMDSRNPQIRLFRLERAMSRKPETECKATGWQEAGPSSVRDFSAVGYQYAKILQEKLHVPVGMIMTTWGGTVVEAWMDRHSLAAFPGIKVFSVEDTARMNKNEPGVLFNAMVEPLVGYGIKGVIWYQGEQNRPNAQVYDRLLAAMVKEWRAVWQCGEWPFYYVQIAPYAYNDKLGPAAPLREAQQRALALIPRSGMVVSMDAGEERSIHPANKTVISQRLACWALADAYGWAGLPYASPFYKAMKISGDTVFVGFDNAPDGLTAFGRPVAAFELAGEDRRFYPARARIVSRGVQLVADSVKAPVAVRYAYRDWVVGDLFNTEGFPVAPFRTDSW